MKVLRWAIPETDTCICKMYVLRQYVKQMSKQNSSNQTDFVEFCYGEAYKPQQFY